MNIEEAYNTIKKSVEAINIRPYATKAEYEKVECIKVLLTAYEKEKEKNKTLEELLQGKLFELYKYYKDLASEYQANCISKNKIKPIQIIDLDGKIHNVYKIEED